MDIQKHQIRKTGADYYAINPKGNVPALTLPGGAVLNEGSAVLQWIADQNPASKLAPAAGTTERYLLQNTLNYISSEFQASGIRLVAFPPNDAAKEVFRASLLKKLTYTNDVLLKAGKFLCGEDLTVADIYLWVMTSSLGRPMIGIDLAPYKNIVAFQQAVQAEPRFQKAQEAMKAASA